MMQAEPLVRTVIDFTQGWPLLNAFQFLADDASKMEVVRQVFDHMTAEAYDFLNNVRNKGINYDNIHNSAYPHLNLNALSYVKESDKEPLGQLAIYLWGLMDYHNLFSKQSETGSLSDDFPYALELVNPQVLVLVSSGVSSEITSMAMNALSTRRV